MSVAACIPSIPVRGELLAQALGSVATQTVMPDQICVSIDHAKLGVSAMRNHAVLSASTEFVAFLDDDDLWYHNHLEVLLEMQAATDADVVFSWCEGNDPTGHFGKEWDNENPFLFPIGYLARREMVLRGGGFKTDFPSGDMAGEDWPMILKFVAMGAKIVPTHKKTWLYRAHETNTSGQPHRW
jgi:glycosyltransferase involved in cell wall biosynthesis